MRQEIRYTKMSKSHLIEKPVIGSDRQGSSTQRRKIFAETAYILQCIFVLMTTIDTRCIMAGTG